MRWLVYRVPPTPASIRRRHVFAWLPTMVGSFKVWLESYEVVEAYQGPTGWTEVNRAVLDTYYV